MKHTQDFTRRRAFAPLISRQAWAALFHIGLATPTSSLVQIALCEICFVRMFLPRKQSAAKTN